MVSLAQNSLRHANIVVPYRLDAACRTVIATPDMHRRDRTAFERETNSTCGVIFPWWDILLGTYIAHLPKSHECMALGLEYFREPSEDSLLSMLMLPIRQPHARARTLVERHARVALCAASSAMGARDDEGRRPPAHSD